MKIEMLLQKGFDFIVKQSYYLHLACVLLTSLLLIVCYKKGPIRLKSLSFRTATFLRALQAPTLCTVS